MKKLLAMVMAVAMTLSLAACGGNSTPAANTDFKVGAIYINSKNDTAGYTYAHHNGITKAMEALGMDPDTQLIIQDEITEDYENVATAVDTLVGEDCDIIFGISFVLRAFQSVRLVQYAFNGIRAGVLALILKALWSMYRQCPKSAVSYVVMAAAFLLTAFLSINVLFVILGCAAFGLLTAAVTAKRNRR